MSKLEKQLNKIEPKVAKFDGLLIDKNKKLEFITRLESLAQKQNLEQTIQLNSDLKFKGNFSQVPITLSLQGAYLDLLNYIVTLEKNEYLFNIKSVDIQEQVKSGSAMPGQSQAPKGKKIMNMVLKIDTYWQ